METLWGLYGGAPVWEEETVELPQASRKTLVGFYGYCIRTGIVKERVTVARNCFRLALYGSHLLKHSASLRAGRMSRFVTSTLAATSRTPTPSRRSRSLSG